jgi:hypothetical protein
LESVFLEAVAKPPVGPKQGKARTGAVARNEWAGLLSWAVAQGLAADSAATHERVNEKVPPPFTEVPLEPNGSTPNGGNHPDDPKGALAALLTDLRTWQDLPDPTHVIVGLAAAATRKSRRRTLLGAPSRAAKLRQNRKRPTPRQHSRRPPRRSHRRRTAQLDERQNIAAHRRARPNQRNRARNLRRPIQPPRYIRQRRPRPSVQPPAEGIRRTRQQARETVASLLAHLPAKLPELPDDVADVIEDAALVTAWGVAPCPATATADAKSKASP